MLTDLINGLSDLLYSYILIILLLEQEFILPLEHVSYSSVFLLNPSV